MTQPFRPPWRPAEPVQKPADDVALASVFRKLLAGDSFVAPDTHDASAGRPVRFTLDDTSVEIDNREKIAVKEVLGW